VRHNGANLFSEKVKVNLEKVAFACFNAGSPRPATPGLCDGRLIALRANVRVAILVQPRGEAGSGSVEGL